MSSPPIIRSLRQDDLKIVKYQIGLSEMGPLAVANHRGCFHPLTVTAWMALSSIMIQFLKWWPATDGPLGIWGVLSPLPAFAATAVPIMFFFDWVHRPTFEKALHKALTAPDMQDPLKHYSLTPASGFYVLENKQKPIGLIALDASSTPTPSRTGSEAKGEVNATAATAIVRHFFVEEAYRITNIQLDLLEYALSRAFSARSSPHRVRIICSDLDTYKADALRAATFHPVSKWDGNGSQEWKVGVFGWPYRWIEITKDEWSATKE